jgi:hypothetical protein
VIQVRRETLAVNGDLKREIGCGLGPGVAEPDSELVKDIGNRLFRLDVDRHDLDGCAIRWGYEVPGVCAAFIAAENTIINTSNTGEPLRFGAYGQRPATAGFSEFIASG